MKLTDMQKKLDELQQKLHYMETVEMSRITELRIESDMGDDFRENEAAKLAMELHDIWYTRRIHLKREILHLKKLLVASRTKIDE